MLVEIVQRGTSNLKIHAHALPHAWNGLRISPNDVHVRVQSGCF
jgi:hypothetical protein